MRVEGFAGPSNVLQALNADAERTINWFLEAVRPGTPAKGEPWMPPRPGLTPYAGVVGSAVRGSFAQDGRAFCVIDTNFYELTSTLVLRGTVASDSNPATICSNGTAGGQLFVTSGGNGYIYDLTLDTLAIIADIDFPNGSALMGEFMDGYFLVLVVDSRRFQISALLDGTDWDPLDVFERSEGSDNLVALKRSHREIWLLGTRTSEVWYDSGDADTPFQPIQGVFLEQGCASGFTAIRVDNTLFWIGLDEHGHGIVYRANGYTPEPISSPAVALRLQRAGGILSADARALAYQINQHLFYGFILPDDNENPSFFYDVSTREWTEFGHWDPDACVWRPFVGQNHMFIFDRHLIGARDSGTLYETKSDLYTDVLVEAA